MGGRVKEWEGRISKDDALNGREYKDHGFYTETPPPSSILFFLSNFRLRSCCNSSRISLALLMRAERLTSISAREFMDCL
jgi:hypothetical protein